MKTDKIVAPLHRVPPEIIVQIIRELLPANIDCNPQMRKRLDVLLTTAGVCRYWRYTALDHATLWSVAPMDRRSLGELFLQRSRNIPFFVVFETKTRKRYPAHLAMVSLLPHMHRVENVHFCASTAVLHEVFSAFFRFIRGAQLKEISVQADEVLGNERMFDLNFLLQHASTLKVLRAGVIQSHFPGYQLRKLSGLTHLEILIDHDVRDVLSLLASLPALTSTKVRVNAKMPSTDNYRIVLPTTLRYIHLQIDSYTVYRVLDVPKIPTDVHLKCEIVVVPTGRPMINEPTRDLTFAPEFFENTTRIEELRISLPSCSGSGPSGSFCIEWVNMGMSRPPIEDLSVLRKLVVGGTIERRLLEHVVKSAPRLISVAFIDCAIVGPPKVNHVTNTFPTLVDAHFFVKAISEEHSASTDPEVFVVNGALEGERLEEFRSLLRSRK